jgi:FtsZ-interacting cell division protein ZipA
MSSRDIMLVLLAVLVVAAAAYAAFALWRNSRTRRRQAIKDRFGPEYDRLLQQHGDAGRAEDELSARAERVRKLPIKALSEGERSSFNEAWRQTQERFVDTPSIAVRSAHDLVQQVMRARGYPVDDFEQRVADLSVDHADVVEHYRAAYALHEANRQGRDDTEELRQAMMHYRALFAELLGTPTTDKTEPSPSSRRLSTAHA